MDDGEGFIRNCIYCCKSTVTCAIIRRGIIRETTDGNTRMNKKPPSVWDAMGLMLQLGLTIAVPLALGAFGGNYLDGLTNHKPLFLLLGLLLGLIVGIYEEPRVLETTGNQNSTRRDLHAVWFSSHQYVALYLDLYPDHCLYYLHRYAPTRSHPCGCAEFRRVGRGRYA